MKKPAALATAIQEIPCYKDKNLNRFKTNNLILMFLLVHILLD